MELGFCRDNQILILAYRLLFRILTLAQKCLSPAKRDLIHAYKLLSGICAKLQDAPNDYVNILMHKIVYLLILLCKSIRLEFNYNFELTLLTERACLKLF